jgi:P-type Cu+ transporter
VEEAAQAADGTSRDPVCGMGLYPATAAAEVKHGGVTFYFCSKECADRFRADPARYESAPGAAT